MSELRKYGVLLTTAKAIQFTLYQVDGVDIEPAATFAAGDIKISKDGGAEANTTNLPTDEGQGYRLILTAAELTASRIRLAIVDQTATKVWLDIDIVIETYGNASAMHAFDLDTAAEAMRGTDNAALASVCTEVRLAELAAANIPSNIDTLLTRIVGTLAAGTHNPASAAQIAVLSDWINGGRLDLILDIIAADTTTDIPALIATAQADLDTITGADGAALASTQQSITFQPLTITAGDAIANITLAGSGTEDGISFTRTGSGDPLDANFIAQINATVDTALTDYDAATGTELAATEAKIDIVDTNVDAILVDTGTTLPATLAAQDAIITEPRLAELDVANLPTDVAANLTAIGNLNDPTAAAIAAAVAAYDMGNGRTIEEALAFLRNKWTIISGTLTVYDTDDTTVLWTSAMTQTAGNPVSASDPV